MKLCRTGRVRRRKGREWTLAESLKLFPLRRLNKTLRVLTSLTIIRSITSISVSFPSHTRHTIKSTTPESNRSNPHSNNYEHNKTRIFTASKPSRKPSPHTITPCQPTTATRATPSTPTPTTLNGTADAKSTSKPKRQTNCPSADFRTRSSSGSTTQPT